MEQTDKKQILEALLLASQEALSPQRLVGVLGESGAREVRALVDELNAEYEESGRGFRIGEVAGGFQLRTLPELAPWLQKLRPQPPLRLSRAALETLALVAYKQPVTRAELEHVRGVDVGAVLASLLERHLLRIAGHREVPGRPMLYATTKRFLEVFGLASLADLPTLREIEELLRDRTAADAEPSPADASGESPGEGRERDEEEADLDPDAELELESPLRPHQTH